MSIKYKSGFTLIEILIALAIIGIFSAIVLPNLRVRLPRYEREEFIARLNAATRLAQQQAVATNKLHQVFFDLSKRQVTVKVEDTRTFTTKKEKDFIPLTAAIRSAFTWPVQLEIRQFLIDGKDALQAFALRRTGQVWFFVTPQGYAQEVIINIVDKKDTIDGRVRQFSLVLNPFNAQFKEYDSFQK